MKRMVFFFALGLIGLVSLAYFFSFKLTADEKFLSPLASRQTEEKKGPLTKYEFETLADRQSRGSQIELEKIISEEEDYTAYLFSFRTEGKKVTGQANIPKKEGKKPVIVMLRGYADDNIYFTGLGTRKAAGVFAENGFITLAPDFLGFGGSDSASNDILEARFEKPVTVLDLLASIKTLPEADPEKIALWGHSNGGQIALSILEITKKKIPTTLWAPVSKGFPQSILFYMSDEPPAEEEEQKNYFKVKETVENFSKEYEPKKFSIDSYFADIVAPLQIHQGTADQLVPISWSDTLAKELADLGKEVSYWTYNADDHNLAKNWDLVVQRDLTFFRKKLDLSDN